MSNDYLPKKDLELKAWSGNFFTVASANEPALGLTPADMAAFGADGNAFNSALDAVNAAKAAYESAVKAKDAARKKFTTDTRPLVRRIQSHAGVTDAMRAQLRISTGKTPPSKSAPVTPASVVATPLAVGVNVLKWHAAGNKPNTQYVIQTKTVTPGARLDVDAGWAFVGLTTRRDFKHVGVTPGAPMAYRIVAARADQSSVPSLPVTVYGS